MNPHQIVIQEAARIGVDPKVALSLWRQESNQGTDTRLKGAPLSRNRGNAIGPWQVVPHYHPDFPIDGSFQDQTRYALNYLKDVGVRKYYGEGVAPKGHPTTDQYEQQVMSRAGGMPAQQPDAPQARPQIDVRTAAIGELPAEMQVAGDPVTGMADQTTRLRVTDPNLIEQLDAAYKGQTNNRKRVTDPALIAVLNKAYTQKARKTNKPLEYTPATMPGNALTDAVIGAGQGATLGWLDELAGLGKNLVTQNELDSAGVTEEQLGNALQGGTRQVHDIAKKRSPWATLGGEIAGGITTGLSIPGGNLTSLGRLATIGAGEGAVAGAGMGNADSVGGRAVDALQGGLVGGVAAPVVGGVAAIAGPAFTGLRQQLIGRPAADAKILVRKAVESDMISPAEARKLLADLGPDGMLADLGQGTRGAARMAASIPGPGQKIGVDALTDRQLRQQAGVAQAAAGRVDAPGENYHDFMRDVIESRQAMAKPLYEQAYKEWITPTAAIQDVLKTPAGKRAFSSAQNSLLNDLSIPMADRIGFDESTGQMSIRLLDQVKRELQDAAGSAIKQNEQNAARMLTNQYRGLTDAMDQGTTSDTYRQARRVYAGHKEIEDAAELGREMLRGRKFAADYRDEFSRHTPSESESFRMGMLQAIQDHLDGTPETADAARKLIRDKRTRDILRTAFRGRDKGADEFIGILRKFSDMTQTRNIADPNVGSQTAMIQGDRAAAESALSTAEAVSAAAMGQFGPAMGRFMRILTGTPELTPDIAHQMAKILFKTNLSNKEINSLMRGVRIAGSAPTAPAAALGATAGTLGGISTQKEYQ